MGMVLLEGDYPTQTIPDHVPYADGFAAFLAAGKPVVGAAEEQKAIVVTDYRKVLGVVLGDFPQQLARIRLFVLFEGKEQPVEFTLHGNDFAGANEANRPDNVFKALLNGQPGADPIVNYSRGSYRVVFDLRRAVVVTVRY